jgi:muconate cycloisomerase
MKIVALEFYAVKLPFRFAFTHSLAARNFSINIICRASLQAPHGGLFEGWGESVPRDYVTGEGVEAALEKLRSLYAPRFLNRQFVSSADLAEAIKQEFFGFGLKVEHGGAAWCALELALLDGAAKVENKPLMNLLGEVRNEALLEGIVYGGVVPFANRKALGFLCSLYRLGGFKTVKVKVGKDFESDLACLQFARRKLGPEMILRIDANCAWTADQTMQFAEKARPLKIASIEQPVKADDLAGLKRIVENIPEQIVADESLCTLAQAEKLAQEKLCTAFNIRISKVGGILPAIAMAQIAERYGIACHLGAQVGESGILSAAARSLACVMPPFENYEGSANFFLLKEDLTRENLTFGLSGRGKILRGNGLGVSVLVDRVRALAEPITSPASAALAFMPKEKIVS